MWTEDFRKYHAAVSADCQAALQTQLEEVERQMPELYAALNLMTFALLSKVSETDMNDGEGGAIFVQTLTPALICAFSQLPLINQASMLNRREVCRRLASWNGWVWYQKFKVGQLTEPSDLPDWCKGCPEHLST